MIQKLVVSFLILGAVVFATALVIMLIGPRMRHQVNMRSFVAPVSPMPQGVVQMDPAAGRGLAAEVTPKTADSLQAGKTYYAYYCVYCHGEQGAGDGGVGQSYVPRPPDLRTAKVQQQSDEQLIHAMLFGTGHEPVLNRIVPEEHVKPLLIYVRTLGPRVPPQP